MKLKTEGEADVNITSLIDCLMNVIVFFMVIISAQYVFGVAIKFPSGGQAKSAQKQEQKEKNIVVYVSAEWIEQGHYLMKDGSVKLNGEEIPLVVSDREKAQNWPEERKKAWDYLKYQMSELLKQGYKKEILMVQGEMKTYHGKTMKVIDIGKELGIDGFSLAPPTK